MKRVYLVSKGDYDVWSIVGAYEDASAAIDAAESLMAAALADPAFVVTHQTVLGRRQGADGNWYWGSGAGWVRVSAIAVVPADKVDLSHLPEENHG